MAPDSLVILLVAIALDFYIGAPIRRRGWFWHPQCALSRVAAWCDARLNRPERTAAARKIRGTLALVVLVLGMTVIGVGFDRLTTSDPLLSILTVLLVTALIDQREAYLALEGVGRCLAAGDRAGAETALALLSRRDPVHLDDYGLARAAIEEAAGRFARQGVAPILAYAFFGVAGILIWWLVLSFRRVVGGLDPTHIAFGAPFRGSDRVLAAIPLRLAGCLLTLAAWHTSPHAIRGALTILRRTKGRSWPEAALAGAVGLALGGPRRYAARVIDAPWIGGGRARVKPGDITAAARLIARAMVLVAALVGLVLGVRLL